MYPLLQELFHNHGGAIGFVFVVFFALALMGRGKGGAGAALGDEDDMDNGYLLPRGMRPLGIDPAHLDPTRVWHDD